MTAPPRNCAASPPGTAQVRPWAGADLATALLPGRRQVLVVLRVHRYSLCQFFYVSSEARPRRGAAPREVPGARARLPQRPARRTRPRGPRSRRPGSSGRRSGRPAPRCARSCGAGTPCLFCRVVTTATSNGVRFCFCATAYGLRAPSIRLVGGGGRRRRRAHVWDMGADAARGRGRRGARRGARDADIRLAIGLPELRDAARGAAILGSGCAPNVWVWYRMVSRRYPRPRALGFAGLLLPISAARPDPAPEPRTLCGSAPHGPGDRSGAVARLQHGGPELRIRT